MGDSSHFSRRAQFRRATWRTSAPARRGSVGYRPAAAATALSLILSAIVGCAPGTPLTREIDAHVRPILTMDPHANWTAHFNRLVDLGSVSVRHLLAHESIEREAAPDDLELMLRMSLVRLLAPPGSRPALSATCLDTTLSLVHFEPRVRHQRIGEVIILQGIRPRAWHEVFPANFDHALASEIDLEADRRAIRAWWAQRSRVPGSWAGAPKLAPRNEWLFPLLERRKADRWVYEPIGDVQRCLAGPLKGETTIDYNLARAACIWLGALTDPAVESRLIDLVGSASDILSYNARFALRHSPDERIRRAIERFDRDRPLRPGSALLVCHEQASAIPWALEKKAGGSRWAPGGNAATEHAARCSSQIFRDKARDE